MLKSRIIALMMVAALSISMLALVSDIEQVGAADGIIYINADGSITPPEANITTTNFVTYTFNGTNVYPIVVNRSNIIINGNGFAVQGKKVSESFGISLYSLSNVTITNVTVKDFYYGIKLNETTSIKILGTAFNNTMDNLWGYDTYKTTISGNHMTGGHDGIYFMFSFSDTISGNNITSNTYAGIQLTNAHNTTISENNISKNKESGPHPYGNSILIYSSTDNQIYANNITEGHFGINLDGCNSTRIYQNNVATHVQSGISLVRCINISMYNNMLNNNVYGLQVVGEEELRHYMHSIETSNLIDGKPAYYLINQHHLTINATTHPEVGFLALINSTDITVEGINVTGSAEGILVAYTSNMKIQNNNFTNDYNGIVLDNSSNNTITGNVIQKTDRGIYITNSMNNTINGNTLEDVDDTGIEIFYSPNCEISNNKISANRNGIMISYSSNVISENNISAIETCISIDVSESIIYANNITNGYNAIDISTSSNSIIRKNNITNNEQGINLWRSNNNTICENNIVHNTYSIDLGEAENNTIYHNNFINNTNPAYTYQSPCTWDNGYPSGGNYWSNHVGVDADYDGISDTQYAIDTDNVDRYPLMGPINVLDAGKWNGAEQKIEIVSNSTVSNFQLNIDQKKVSFNVTGESSNGFCRITIPNIIVQEMWQNNYTVLLNGEPLDFTNWTYATDTYIYVNYTHSPHEIAIVPEFPSAAMSLIPVAIAALTIILKRKIRAKQP